MDYKFTLEFNDYKETYSVWDEWNMADNELDVEYWNSKGRAVVSGVKFHGIEMIGLLMCLPKQAMEFIEKAAQEDYEKRKQAQIHANYPNLHPTTEEIIDMLKLK
jgi:hypothetical protein